VSANRPAKRLLESVGTPNGSDRSAAATAVEDAPPASGLRLLASFTHSTSDASGPVVTRLPRPHARPLELLAVPVRAPDDPFSLPDARTIVFIADPDGDDGPGEEELTAAFNLTATEARLVVRLLRGETLEDAAHVLGIKISTARTHLAHVFLKTGASRQPELVRLLLSMPRRDGEHDSKP
jgi:DNA-binding CsgD family transcriptional regulator